MPYRSIYRIRGVFRQCRLERSPSTPSLSLPSSAEFPIPSSSYALPSAVMSLSQLLLVTLLSSTTAWVAYSWICLFRNYIEARKVGVPIRVIPISHGNPFWMVVDRKILSLFKKLPFGNGNFTRYNWRGWEIEDRYRSHLEMGDVYVQVTPEKNWLYLCNPEALMDVFRRRSDFPRPLQIYGRSHFQVQSYLKL